ncbi:DEP domain-containing mTOR-interacting protein-like isoform X2 [Lates japonicus]|uniref:DEP domain-containing mTOR-interacting protein-like isoform X2 n=1 Tax=Lates japonicus TaxID=270547 RepID=A0AAD3MUG1_LATJO|nr:DEP domain-containing mTOR-interacting protein-like isoform X2 [Lates japonicus]
MLWVGGLCGLEVTDHVTSNNIDPVAQRLPAGMKVCQFVVSVNGLNVLNLDYRTVSHLILTGPRTVVMEVMEETDH